MAIFNPNTILCSLNFFAIITPFVLYPVLGPEPDLEQDLFFLPLPTVNHLRARLSAGQSTSKVALVALPLQMIVQLNANV